MSYTYANNPTTPTYENVAQIGAIAYDENTVTYDSAIFEYDGLQTWSNANSPTTPTYTDAASPHTP